MADLRVAVVGVGGIAQRVHIPTLVKTEGAKLTTVVDVDPTKLERVRAQYNVPRALRSVGELTEGSEVDCALVVTPPEYHPEVTIALLKAGVDVFCEKPLALNLTDARATVEAAEGAGRILMAGFNRRFMPAFVRAKLAFAERPLEVLTIEKNKADNEHRALTRDGIHMVDTMRWLCGEPVEVSAWARCAQDQEHEETILANVKFDTGALASLLIHRNGGMWIERAELYGGGCTAIVDAPDDTLIAVGGRTETFSVGAWATLADRLGFTQEIKHFVECVRERREPVNSGREALKTHELVDSIYRKAGLPPM